MITRLFPAVDSAPARLIRMPWALAVAAPGLFLGGLDGPLGQAFAGVMTAIALASLLLVAPPPLEFWRTYGLPLGLFALALAWLLLVGVVRYGLMSSLSGLPVAPDLFVPKYLSTLAGFWALLIGLLSSRLAKWRLLHADWLLLLLTLHATAGLTRLVLVELEMSQQWQVLQGGRFAGLIGNANVTACASSVGCILAWSSLLPALDVRRRPGSHAGKVPWWLILPGGALAMNGIALILTASRLPFLLTVVALGWLAVIHWRAQRARLRRFMPGLALAGLVMLVVQTQLAAGLVDRIDMFSQDLGLRWQMWGHFSDIVPGAFWTGYGPGSFSSLNVYMMNRDMGSFALWRVNSPHNLILQLMLVGGLPYLLLMVAGAAGPVRDIVRSLRWKEGDVRFAALVFGAASLLLSASIDIALDMPVGAILLGLLTGLAWGYATGGPRIGGG